MDDPKEFIAKIAMFAATDTKRTGVPASLTIAQAALESNWGRSGLTLRANNLFGIKGTGPAGSCTMPTTEFVAGRPVKVNAAFRAYNNWGESIADHSALLVNGVSWNRKLYAGCIGVDGKTAARAVQKAGYATDPGYADKLIAIMDAYGLEKYDEIDKPKEDDKLELSNYQWGILEQKIKALFDAGKIKDEGWFEKAKTRKLTVSELAWLTFVIA